MHLVFFQEIEQLKLAHRKELDEVKSSNVSSSAVSTSQTASHGPESSEAQQQPQSSGFLSSLSLGKPKDTSAAGYESKIKELTTQHEAKLREMSITIDARNKDIVAMQKRRDELELELKKSQDENKKLDAVMTMNCSHYLSFISFSRTLAKHFFMLQVCVAISCILLFQILEGTTTREAASSDDCTRGDSHHAE
jgi:hypothetical protein